MARLMTTILTLALAAALAFGASGLLARDRGLPITEHPDGWPRTCVVHFALQPGERAVVGCHITRIAGMMELVSIRTRHQAVDSSVIDFSLRSGWVTFSLRNASELPAEGRALVEVW
jgi:hypothetical protein